MIVCCISDRLFVECQEKLTLKIGVCLIKIRDNSKLDNIAANWMCMLAIADKIKGQQKVSQLFISFHEENTIEILM